MSACPPHNSHTSTSNLKEFSAKKGKRSMGTRYTEPAHRASSSATMALVPARSAARGQAALQDQDGERGRNTTREFQEPREYDHSEKEEEYEPGPTSDDKRSPKFKPQRRTTVPRAREDEIVPVSRFINKGSVQNQVGFQRIRGDINFGDVAGRRRRQEPLQTLRRAETDVRGENIRHESRLEKAAFYGEQEVVKSLIGTGADVNAQSGPFGTALQAAAAKGHLRVVMLLLQAGANVNAVGGKFGSALHAAAAAGCPSIVAVLITAGADVHAVGEGYHTVMRAAMEADNWEVVGLLLDAGASADA